MSIIEEIKYKDGSLYEVVIEGESFDKFKLLAFACELSYKDKRTALGVVKLASKLFHGQDDWTFNALYSAAIAEILSNSSYGEFEVHSLFNRNITKLIDCEVIKKKQDQRHQPDSWISVGGEEIPVEIKKGDFDRKALEQLQRYIKFYGTERGVGVGKTLKTPIPANIIFVSINDLQRAQELSA